MHYPENSHLISCYSIYKLDATGTSKLKCYCKNILGYLIFKWLRIQRNKDNEYAWLTFYSFYYPTKSEEKAIFRCFKRTYLITLKTRHFTKYFINIFNILKHEFQKLISSKLLQFSIKIRLRDKAWCYFF